MYKTSCEKSNFQNLSKPLTILRERDPDNGETFQSIVIINKGIHCAREVTHYQCAKYCKNFQVKKDQVLKGLLCLP